MNNTLTKISSALAGASAALICASYSPPAHADLLFRFYNQAPIPAKGIVQNLSVLWLKPGQNEVARASGNWGQAGQCPVWGCPKLLQDSYIANFEHLGDNSINYCTWKIDYHVQRQSVKIVSKRDGQQIGKVTIKPTLKHELAGYECTVGGQLEAPWTSERQGDGAELHFYLKKL